MSHAYLFLDEKTGIGKGFALLTKAREEGEKYELRELDMGQVESLFQQVHVAVDIGLPEHVAKDGLDVSVVDANDGEAVEDTEDMMKPATVQGEAIAQPPLWNRTGENITHAL